MSDVAEETAERTGLEQLRALIAADRRPGIVETLDFDFVEVEEGRAVFEGVPGLHAYNPIGTVHGGYTATLLDSACGCAVQSKLNGSQAEGRVVTIGRRAAFAEASLTDSDGRLLASATSTLLVFER